MLRGPFSACLAEVLSEGCYMGLADRTRPMLDVQAPRSNSMGPTRSYASSVAIYVSML